MFYLPFYYSLPSMALTQKGHRRCAPMLKNIPYIFLFAAIHGAHPKGPAKAVQ